MGVLILKIFRVFTLNDFQIMMDVFKMLFHCFFRTGAEKAMKEHLEYIHHDLKIVQRKYPEYFKD